MKKALLVIDLQNDYFPEASFRSETQMSPFKAPIFG